MQGKGGKKNKREKDNKIAAPKQHAIPQEGCTARIIVGVGRNWEVPKEQWTYVSNAPGRFLKRCFTPYLPTAAGRDLN
ncbi:MAG TPA: hypothetical protein VLT16_18400 [Candidatus Limnocylindrales bacterium]|nr:hypothetical protein [Candidatus Limnocylindrales bacterium]